MVNNCLRTAQLNKKDEFYTMYEDIEKEILNYKQHLKNKIVYCNCDSENSNFYKFFKNNFKRLQLKELWITGLSKKCLFYNGKEEQVFRLKDGCFQNNIDLLKRSDVVVTNPPFSQFREFIDLMIEYKKDFIVWGNNNAITYKNIFPLLKEKIVFLGNLRNKTCTFYVPEEYNENKMCKVPSCSVFTTFNVVDVPKLELVKYNNNDYEMYDNLNIINIDKIKNIPDYDGFMGVPITFMNYWNDNQFEVLDCFGRYFVCDYFSINKKMKLQKDYGTQVNNKKKFARILIRKK